MASRLTCISSTAENEVINLLIQLLYFSLKSCSILILSHNFALICYIQSIGERTFTVKSDAVDKCLLQLDILIYVNICVTIMPGLLTKGTFEKTQKTNLRKHEKPEAGSAY